MTKRTSTSTKSMTIDPCTSERSQKAMGPTCMGDNAFCINFSLFVAFVAVVFYLDELILQGADTQSLYVDHLK